MKKYKNEVKKVIEKLTFLSKNELKNLIELADKYIEVDTKSSLTKSREALEMIVYDVYFKEFKEKPQKLQLGFVINEDKLKVKLETRILKLMNYVREMGNLGPHSYEETRVEEKDAYRVLDALADIIYWYLETYYTEEDVPSIESIDSAEIFNLEIEYQLGKKLLGNKDDRQAFKHFLNAAKEGHKKAQRELGFLFHFGGRGVEKDYAEAFNWYQKARLQGDTYSLIWLGRMYLYGDGVKKNVNKAFEVLIEAAKQGETLALNGIALVYLDEGDDKKAVEFLLQGAELGEQQCQYNLSQMYKLGLGIDKSESKANYWLKKSRK